MVADIGILATKYSYVSMETVIIVSENLTKMPFILVQFAIFG